MKIASGLILSGVIGPSTPRSHWRARCRQAGNVRAQEQKRSTVETDALQAR
jgi:hypothetical protein